MHLYLFYYKNVYVWTKYNINYKLILQYNHHFSYWHEILKRVAFFSTVLLLTILFYLLIHLKIWDDLEVIKIYLPSLVWICLIFYMTFPYHPYFNYEGRMYIANIFKKVFSNPWAPSIFRDSFTFSNLESLRTPI